MEMIACTDEEEEERPAEVPEMTSAAGPAGEMEA